jgi:hypothetical protein
MAEGLPHFEVVQSRQCPTLRFKADVNEEG